MTAIEQTLVCRRCEVIPKLVQEEGGREVVRCPACGVFGDADEVTRRATEHAQQSIVNSQLDDFQRGMARSTKRQKNVTYRPGKLPAIAQPDFIFR